jgi:multidrug efflux pump subunit AcrA (membrane-fusion protein)
MSEPSDLIDAAPAEAEDAAANPRLVPVTESIRYRRRAQAAEQQLQELSKKLAESKQELDAAREDLQSLERRQRIDQLLMESDAVDLEAARLLTEIAVQQMEEPDVQIAVSELRRRKPFLFRRTSSGAGSSMSPKPRGHGHTLDDAAGEAVTTGNRRDLLRYLRLRRAAK